MTFQMRIIMTWDILFMLVNKASETFDKKVVYN